MYRYKCAMASASCSHVKQSDTSILVIFPRLTIPLGKIDSMLEWWKTFPFSLSAYKIWEFTSWRIEKSLSWLKDKSSVLSCRGNIPYLSITLLCGRERILSNGSWENVSYSKLVSWLPDKSISTNCLLNESLPMNEIWLFASLTRIRLMAPLNRKSSSPVKHTVIVWIILIEKWFNLYQTCEIIIIQVNFF